MGPGAVGPGVVGAPGGFVDGGGNVGNGASVVVVVVDDGGTVAAVGAGVGCNVISGPSTSACSLGWLAEAVGADDNHGRTSAAAKTAIAATDARTGTVFGTEAVRWFTGEV